MSGLTGRVCLPVCRPSERGGGPRRQALESRRSAATRVAISPLPAGNRRLALLAATHLLAVNGLVADLDPAATHDLLAAIKADAEDVASVAAWLDGRVTSQDPERYDPTKGYRFATLATSCIRQAIVAAVARLASSPGAS